jgi:hypothetical protein
MIGWFSSLLSIYYYGENCLIRSFRDLSGTGKKDGIMMDRSEELGESA